MGTRVPMVGVTLPLTVAGAQDRATGVGMTVQAAVTRGAAPATQAAALPTGAAPSMVVGLGMARALTGVLPGMRTVAR